MQMDWVSHADDAIVAWHGDAYCLAISNGGAAMKTIRYYAYARMPDDRLGQLLVERDMDGVGRCVARRQSWTGVIYRTDRQAMQDLGKLNRAIAAN